MANDDDEKILQQRKTMFVHREAEISTLDKFQNFAKHPVIHFDFAVRFYMTSTMRFITWLPGCEHMVLGAVPEHFLWSNENNLYARSTQSLLYPQEQR